MAIPKAKIDHCREWLEKARDDLDVMSLCSAAVPPRLAGTAFHAQQAVEKAVKAFLFWHDVAFKKTHDIEELRALVQTASPELAARIAPLIYMSVFAWTFRYPGGTEPLPDEIERAADDALRIVDDIARRLPKEVTE